MRMYRLRSPLLCMCENYTKLLSNSPLSLLPVCDVWPAGMSGRSNTCCFFSIVLERLQDSNDHKMHICSQINVNTFLYKPPYTQYKCPHCESVYLFLDAPRWLVVTASKYDKVRDNYCILLHFDHRTIREPSTETLLRLAERLAHSCFSFSGEFYTQTNGVATGTIC